MKGLWCLLLVISGLAKGADKGADRQTIIAAAQDKMQATFKNLQFTSFKPGPVKGLYELNAGGSIIYYHPAKELLLMGEFYTKAGENLTAKALAGGLKQAQDALPLDMALVIGPDDAKQTIIEFTDPNCGYCKGYDRFVTDEEKAKPVKRMVFFDTRGSADAKQKVVHILCSQDRAAAMERIYLGIKPTTYLHCDEGERIHQAHSRASRTAGVRGTPSFILNGQLILGFKSSVKQAIKI